MTWKKVRDLQKLLLEQQAALLKLEETLPEEPTTLPDHGAPVPEQLLTPRDILVAPDATPDLFKPIDPSEIESLPAEHLQPTPPPSHNGHLLGDLFDLWSKGRSVTESTKERDRLRFASLAKFGITPKTALGDLSTQRLRELQAEMVRKYNPNTVRDTFMKLLRPMLELAVENGWLQTNPASKVKLVKHLEPDRKEHTWEEFHSGDFTRQGGTLQMVQLWVNLRAQDKSAPPGYQTLLQGQIPNVSLPKGAGTVRVIAGEYGGRQGPAKTFTPISLWDVDLRAGGTAALPLPEGHTAMFLVLSGMVVVDGNREAGEGDLAIFDRSGEGIALSAKCDAKLLVMGGEPIAEPVVGRGPFVMNSQEEIQQAFEYYQLGRMGGLA